MAGTYTYLAADLLTNTILGELLLTDVSFDRKLNGSGAFAGKLRLDDPKVQKSNPINLTQPARTAIYVDRDGVLEWGGILWTRSYGDADSQRGELSIAGQEFWSYFARRRLKVDKVYTNADQLHVAHDLVNYAQSVSGGNIGVQVGSETSGQNISVTYYGYERRTISNEIDIISKATGGLGFDYSVEVAYASGVPTKTLRLGYPRIGVASAASGLLFEYPGNILSYAWPEDGSLMADAVGGVGAGNSGTTLLSDKVNAAMLAGGYPLLEADAINKAIATQALLDQYTTAILAAYQTPPVAATVVVRADADPTLGSYQVGDEARFRLTDPRWPTTLDTFCRIVAIKPTPDNEGVETAELTLGPVVA